MASTVVENNWESRHRGICTYSQVLSHGRRLGAYQEVWGQGSWPKRAPQVTQVCSSQKAALGKRHKIPLKTPDSSLMQKPQATGEGQNPHQVLDPSLKQIRHLQRIQSVIRLRLEEGPDRNVEEKAAKANLWVLRERIDPENSSVYSSYIHNCQILETTQCPSVGEWINK